MDCSCPDWAVPCKHLAAVINLIANEIDRNPFVIFKLHDYDIIEELRKRGVEAMNESVLIPEITSLAVAEPSVAYGSKEFTDLESIDFSVIEGMRENLISLLTEKPVFCSKDFKKVLDTIYKRTAKSILRQTRQSTGSSETSPSNFGKYSGIALSLSDNGFFSCCTFQNGQESFSLNSPEELTSFLSQIEPRSINRLSPGFLHLYFTYHFSRKLTEKSAFIPQLVQLPDKSYTVRWIPAITDQNIRNIFDCLAAACPPGVVVLGSESEPLHGEEQLNSMIALFIQQFIIEAGIEKSMEHEPVYLIFADNYSHMFVTLGETEIPSSIQRWIDRFYRVQSQIVENLICNIRRK